MKLRANIRRLTYRWHAHRWARDFVLAVVLTIAAVVFIAAAIVGGRSENPPFAAARTPPTN